MQSSLIEVKSQSDMLLMRAESHENSKLYKKCLKLVDDGKYKLNRPVFRGGQLI